MRKARILIFSAWSIFAGASSAFSAPRPDQSNCGDASTGHVSPSILGLLRQYPDGGDGLTTAVIDILGAGPAAAGAIVALAKLAGPDQKAAIVLGILRVLNGGCGCNSESAEIIRAALRCADPVLRDSLQNQLCAENGHGGAGAGFSSAFSAPRPDQSNCGDVAAGHASPSLLGLLRQYPDGGDGLAAAVIDMLGSDPTAAGAIVALAKLASPDQKAAIVLGILRVLNGRCGCNSESAEIIRAALRCADPVFRDLLAALQNQLCAENGHGGAGGGFSSGGGAGGILPPAFVSPN